MFSLKDYESLDSKNIDCCLVDTWLGNGIIRRRWNSYSGSASFRWEGQQELLSAEPNPDSSFKFGFALDLDEGTLNVYKNDRRLGTLRSGLVGEYCWVVTISPDEYDSVDVTISR